MTTSPQPTVQLFWTGGLDSSFRLLWLLLVEQREVVPLYLLDPGRRSLNHELLAMQRLWDKLRQGHPEAADRLHPIRFFFRPELPPSPKIEAAYHRLLLREPILGIQYLWLARLTTISLAGPVEVCVHCDHDRNGNSGVTHLVQPFLVAEPGFQTPRYRLNPACPDADLQDMFAAFALPFARISKQEIVAEIARQGWEPLLSCTWFCHRPRGRHPCGTCVPCQVVVKEGLAYRLPWSARLRYWLIHGWRPNRHGRH
jgi:hypothetical protein